MAFLGARPVTALSPKGDGKTKIDMVLSEELTSAVKYDEELVVEAVHTWLHTQFCRERSPRRRRLERALALAGAAPPDLLAGKYLRRAADRVCFCHTRRADGLLCGRGTTSGVPRRAGPGDRRRADSEWRPGAWISRPRMAPRQPQLAVSELLDARRP